MIQPGLQAILMALQQGGQPTGNLSALGPLLAMLRGQGAAGSQQAHMPPGPMARAQTPDPRNSILSALGGQ